MSKRETARQLNCNLEEIGRMLNSMMGKADSFWNTPAGVLHKDATEYFASDH